jgi:hypothetical protein
MQDDENSVMTKDTDDSILTGLDGDESTCMSTSKRGSDEEEEKDDESGNEYDENQSVKEHDGEREVGCNYLNELVELLFIEVRGKQFTICTEIVIILGMVRFMICGGRLRYKRYDAHFLKKVVLNFRFLLLVII